MNCHVVIFAETVDHRRDLEEEELLGDIIREGGDVLSYLNDTDGLEGEGEAGSGERTEEGVVEKSSEIYINSACDY